LDGKNDDYSIDDTANTLVLPSLKLKRATKIISKVKRLPAFYRKSKGKSC
jgi:hypothetical protein